MIIHTVNKGDTLWLIANRYGTTIPSIVNANGLQNANQLVVGQSLVIPIAATSYIVKSGDTLWNIGQKFGVSINSIIQANHIQNPAMINVGTTLIIPPFTHQVQPGEALWQIAAKYGVTTQAIIDTNRIENPNLIYSGMVLVIPRPKPTIEVNGYTYQAATEAADTIDKIGNLLTYISPFAYLINADGTLYPYKNDQTIIDAAQSKNIVPMMSISNFTSQALGSNVAHTILASSELQDKLLTNIISIMKEKGYKVLNIDFENVLQTDRELYNQFLERAVARLHPEGFLVSTALAPKTSASQQGLLYEAHDYEAHGRIVDFVVLMTYEWGYRYGPPQAISPLNQIRRVIEYALTVIPPEKIFMGFQLYARDWVLPHVKGQQADTFSPKEAELRAIRYNATIQFDPVAQSPYYRYVDEQGVTHEVWFEDARSAQAKYDLIKEYNLRGVSYWVLGYPYPQNWSVLDANFNIKKLT